MGCVNKSSKEFKNLITKHNVDGNQLELIVHKYWLETGNETLFPTDIYIQKELGDDSYAEPSKNVRKLWGLRYSTSREYRTLSDAERAYKEAVKFFPASAIRYYRNAKGNFTFKVQKPVEYLDSKDAFFKDYDGGSITKNTKTIDLNIEEKRSYGIDKVQELYNRFNTDKTSKALADRVFNIAKDLGLRISFDESLPFGTIGRYSNNNSIVYKKSFFERDMLNDKKAPIILHEMLHTLSMYALSDQTKGWRRPEALEQFRTEINSLYQDLKDNPILKGERGVTDVNEFIAELANPVFRAKIQNIDRDSKAAQKNEKKSFWSRIVDAFKSLLGLHVTNTYYQRSMNALDKALSSFDVDTYMRYNGIKNTLRQGYNAKDWEFNSMSDEQLKSKVDEFANTIKNNNQYSEKKNKLQYEAAIKSAGRIFESTFNLIGNEQQGLGGSSKEKADNSQSLRKQLHEESSKQQKELISWATKNKQLVVEPDDFYEEELGESLAGSETRVWRKGNNVVKSISLNHYGTPKALMERILIHNIAFPNTAMTMQKVGTSDKGMSIIVEQPLIIDSGTIPTMQEIEDFMIIQGFTHTKGQGVNAEYSKDDYLITDIRPENVIKQPDGTLAVIDCFAMFKNVDAQKTSQSTLQEFISSLSGKDLKDELSTIKQEYADYNLINGIEEEKKHSGKAVSQDFTFADGTTIKAPFRPNAQQVDALNEMDRFMKSSETTMTLSGYAGTGKTSLMEMIAKKATMQGESVLFCASTNKAAAVLNERVSKAGFKATTLNKLFGINVEVDMNGSFYNAKNLVNTLKDVDITPGTTVIIDEASMINEENYHIINGIAKKKDLQIIYVGDEAQLAPVGETQTSKVFRNGDGKVIRLTQVERTADNAILKEATDIRNGKSLSGESSFNSKGEGVAYIFPSHQNAINDVIEHYVKGLKSNPNHFRILAYSNKAVTAYNKQVRDLLGYDSPAPHVGEPMMGYTQWGYDWRDKSYRLTNSESYRVTRVDKPKTVTIKSEDGHTLAMEAIPVTMVDSMGKVDTFNYIDVKNNTQNREVAKLLSEDKQFLWQRYRQVSGRQAKAEILTKINAIDNFLFINDNIEDDKGNLLSKKVIDFGYAMTVHKSQGSTFTHVLLDDVDIARFSRDNSMSNFEAVNWDDVEMGDDLTGTTFDDNASEEVDFGLGTDTSASAKEDSILNQSTPQTINKRQQLEYVGVSRATDTVTIISNNVKKEGSPLHPENAIKEDNNRSDNNEYLLQDLKPQNVIVKVVNGEKQFYVIDGDFYDSPLSPTSYEGMITPDKDTVFVFGSNPEGRHGAGAAKTAKDKFGAIYGQGEGLQGNAYALPTKDLRVKENRSLKSISAEQITDNIRKMYDVARQNPSKKFKVAYTNGLKEATLNGYTGAEMIKMFKDAGPIPSNVYFNKNWTDHWSEVKSDKENAAQQYQLDQLKSNDVNGLYSEDGKTPITIYRGYALNEDREARTLAETVGKTAVDYDDSFKGALYFTSSEEEASDYAKGRTDKSEEPPTAEHPEGGRINRHYTGDYAKVSKFYIASTAKVEHYKDIRDYKQNGKNSSADVIVLDKGTMWADNTEYVVRNPDVVVFDTENKGIEPIVENPSLSEQLISHLKSQGINVLNREAMAEFLKTHKLEYLQQAIAYGKENPYVNSEYKAKVPEILSIIKASKYNKPGTDAVTIDSDNHKVIYLIDHSADSELEDNLKTGDGFGIRKVYNINKLSENDIREIARNIAGDYRNSEEFVRNRLQRLGINSENLPHIDLASAIQRGVRDNGKMDGGTRGFGKQAIKNRSDINGRKNQGVLPLYTTEKGEVYGFVDKDGNIYLDETKISPEHPIHEYTHLWDRTVQQKNPKLWQKGVELMKQTSLWNEIFNDANYGKQWQSMNLPQEKLDNLIASEVHARFTGEGGEQLLEKLAKEKGQEGIIEKLKQWILDVWKDLKATFGSWSQEDLNKLTLKDFNHMTVRDFTEGINLKEASNATYTKENTIKKEEAETNAEQPSLAEGTAQMVSLPGYEYYRDLYTDTPVDAEWKVSYLKELDAQLSLENPEEENQNILNQMDKLLEATSEEEYKQDSKKDKKNLVVVRALAEHDKIVQQLNDLLENKDLQELECPLTAQEIRHVAEQIANQLSDLITQLQEEEGLAQFQYKRDFKLNFQTASRKKIVETVGINNMIYRAKRLFEPQFADYKDTDTLAQAIVITQNWDAMMYLAADVFAMNEGFGITKDYSKKDSFTTTDAPKIDTDNFNDYSNDPDYERENGEKDEQEHWQVEQRTIDVLNSMSALVRQGIHECFVLDKDGNKVLSRWQIAERVNPRAAVNSLLRWAQGSSSLDDMINKLSAKQANNPWLSQLITRLSDKSGKEADFQSQFYGVFSKPFQAYSIVLMEDGKYKSIPVNSHPALSEAMKSITAQFRVGEHPLFTEKRINGRLLGTKDTVGESNPFNFFKARHEMERINTIVSVTKEVDEATAKKVIDNVLAVCRALGYMATEDMISEAVNADNINTWANDLHYITDDLTKAANALNTGKIKSYDPFKYYGDFNISKAMREFLAPVLEKAEDTAVNAFYDSGKMYQSYVTPSFMTKLMDKFKYLQGDEFREFIMKEYGFSEWFKSGKRSFDIKQGWRNRVLQRLANDENTRKAFDHKVELNFNKHNYMRNMSDQEYTVSLITEFFAEDATLNGRPKEVPMSWYRVPMQSNKPSSEFIKLYSYRGTDYKENVTHDLYEIFLQELSRIQTVKMRNLSKNSPEFIKNFDSNGKKFCFLPVLNSYLENTDTAKAKRTLILEKDGTVSADNNKFAELLQKKVEGMELTNDEEAAMIDLAQKAIRQSVEERVQSILDNWEKNGILEAAKKINGIYSEIGTDKEIASSKNYEPIIQEHVRQQVETFLWNDTLMSKNILLLTIGDIAFYKDAEDLQKRLAQLHAPGVRGNADAIDYKGNRVSDGNYRTAVLKDFDNFKSNLIANITEVFDRKIERAATPEQKKGLEVLKDSLVRPRTYNADGTVKDKGGKYWNINVADAQGFSSPSSYRKKAFIFGRWSKHAEDIYQKLAKGEYNYTDLETAFQPLKPFVYSRLQKNLGVAEAPIHNVQVPFQAKNAEYLLIMADALLKGESLSRPNLLRAVYRVMEDSEKLNPTKGIDTVQFESAIKSGLQGRLDIAQFRNMEGGEEAAYTYMIEQIYKPETDGEGKRVYQNYNTDVFVHETSYDNYCLQQEVPEHFKQHSQAHGSQIRMITPSDLDLYTYDAKGNQIDNYYEWDEPDGTHRKVKADEFKKEYEETIAKNIEESMGILSAEFHLDSNDKKERNLALSRVLQNEIMSSPRYGIDLLQACTVDKETGEFRIPKGDPIQAKRIEQLINSIIKNRVNKQKIAGGPIVQVSNFGTSQQLHIRFTDKSKKNGIIPLEEEYNPDEHDGKSYKEYIKENQGGIAYFEVFAPIWDNELFDKFADENGNINVDVINAIDPELLKMVSYRIPTEDKYSCAPMKVVGFIPREAGDAIMLPYELTEIDDSDFDVDKRYVMRKDIPIREKNYDDYAEELEKKGKEIYKEIFGKDEQGGYVERMVSSLAKNPKTFPKDSPFRKALFAEYQKLAFDTEAPTSGRFYRDNKIIDMTYAVLTNEMTADKILNPGGFDAPKKMGYMVAAYKNPANRGKNWAELQNMSIDELKDLSYTDKDLTYADTQVQFYKQNSAAASLIGVFAVNKVAHAVLEGNSIFLDVAKFCGELPFTIADTTFKDRMQVDAMCDQEGNLIGKTLGSLVSASADAVKDPILNLMNVNMTTAGMLNTMLRLGMPFNDAALFLSQDIIERLLNEFNRQNLTNHEPLDNIIKKWLDKYEEKNGIAEGSNIKEETLSREELVKGLTSEEHEATDYKVLLAFQKLRSLTEAMRKLTFATRFNSISSAVGPLIVDNLILEQKMQSFLDNGDGTGFYASANPKDAESVDINTVFSNHPILYQFARTVDIAKGMTHDMPTGSEGFRGLLRQLPSDLSDKMFRDKKLLDEFSTFYQSYLLIKSGVVDSEQLSSYVDGFPQWFMKQGYKEKYSDNALIQAIKMNVSKKTGKPFLTITITGMDEQQKEELRSAWTDLHRADPTLSKRLFDYSFFRAGIGFSPKTFMSLVPTYVKERLQSKDGRSSYVDTYRHFPNTDYLRKTIIDQFVRNNWNNTKLVPIRGGEDTKYNVDLAKGTCKVYRDADKIDVKDLSYMKTKIGMDWYLWKRKESKGEDIEFERIEPLGNNGEYLEISLGDIKTPLDKVSKKEAPKSQPTTSRDDASVEDTGTKDLKEQSPQEAEAQESPKPTVSDAESTKKVDEVVNLLIKQNPALDKESAKAMFENIKSNPRPFRRFLQNVFKHKDLELNETQAVDEFKKYC